MTNARNGGTTTPDRDLDRIFSLPDDTFMTWRRWMPLFAGFDDEKPLAATSQSTCIQPTKSTAWGLGLLFRDDVSANGLMKKKRKKVKNTKHLSQKN